MPLQILFIAGVLFSCLLLMAGIFTALESALFTLRDKNLDRIQGKLPTSNRSQRLIRHTRKTLERVSLLSSLSNLLVVTCALFLCIHAKHELDVDLWLSSSILLITSICSVEFIPRAIALRSPTAVIRWTLPVFLFARRIILPVIWPLQKGAFWIASKINPAQTRPPALMNHAELITFVDMHEEEGNLDAQDASFLHNTIQLEKLAVRDLMTPRVDLPLMPTDASDEEALSTLTHARHPFIVVYDKKLHAVAHVISVSQWKQRGRPHWREMLYTPTFVPESVNILRVWNQHLADNPQSVVVVLDEFSGFQGVLTHQAILHFVLEKAAPSPYHEPQIQLISAGHYLIAGHTRIDEVEYELDLQLHQDEFDTIGAYVISKMEQLPKPGQVIQIGNYEFRVKRLSKARIHQLEIQQLAAS